VRQRHSQMLVVVLLLLVILTWLVLDTTGGSNPVRDALLQVMSPAQYALQQLASPIIGAVSGGRNFIDLRAELDAAQQEIAELRSQVILLQEAAIENETLRLELGFRESVTSGRYLAAEIIGYDPSDFVQCLIIDRGESDGLDRGMVVLSSEGLVGRISEVSSACAKVMLITDPSSSVSARIQRTRDTGIVQGYPGGQLIMRYIPQENEIIPGDVVLTSGLGGNFPSRLPIGQITSVAKSDVDMFQTARMVPSVDLNHLEMVMVLLSFTPLDDW